MNILCLDQFADLGGAQRCLLDVIPAMLERGWSVHLAAPAGGQLAAAAARYQVAFHAIRCGPFSSGRKSPADMLRFALQIPGLTRRIRDLARHTGAQLLYVNGPRLLPAAAVVARGGPRLLFHAHSLLAGSSRRLAGRSIVHAGATVVAACRFVAAPLEPYAPSTIRIIYNGVTPQPAVERALHTGARIGVIGRIAPEKGQAEFLEAARIIYAGLPQARFVVCGAPLFGDPAAARYAHSLRALAEGLPVEFAGWQDDIAPLLAGLDMLIVPSATVDATPRVILEAFSAGVPVVAFAAGGIPEIVTDGVTGFLVRQRTPAALADAIMQGLRDPQTMLSLAAAARHAACTRFHVARYRAEILDAVARLANISL